MVLRIVFSNERDCKAKSVMNNTAFAKRHEWLQHDKVIMLFSKNNLFCKKAMDFLLKGLKTSFTDSLFTNLRIVYGGYLAMPRTSL